uniref:BRCT domain-containing protein n=1 Tax=Scylla olivacea TaxID=85551 RepID=A0A0P4WG19_SCYOL
MAARLSFQLDQCQRRFLFSAISSDLEKSLQQKIESLQGRVVLPITNSFSSLCTHVIAQEFSPTEKVLGALAGGKWLLTVSYIQDSYKKGCWLNEEDYEYTNFNKVAAYHRCNWELRNCGLYEGWKVLVVMGCPRITRTFNRILAAGGAEIASKKDTTDVDFVITKKDLMKYAQAMVNSFVPLVDVTYVKDTLLFRNDPADLKKCDLRHQHDFEIPSKSAATTSYHSKSDYKAQGYCASPRKPATDTLQAKRKQTCIKTKQTTMTQFLKPTIKEVNKISKEKEDKNLPVTNSAAMQYTQPKSICKEESEAAPLTSSQCNTVFSSEIKKRAVPSMSRECSPASLPELKKGRVLPKTPSFTITKSHAKKAILNFLRTRGCLNEVCCTNLFLIPTENTESESRTRETITQQDSFTPDEPREMTKMEINLYTCFLAPELHDQELDIHGLDFLLDQLSSYLYPPPAIMGSLLRDLILETPSRIVHSRALRVAYRVLSLHPPTTTKMRKYYLRLLEKAVQEKASGNYIVWTFIQRVIHCALKDSDKTVPSPDTQENEGLDGATKALDLLEFLITLIIEDIKNSPYGKAVQELLTWNIFWGPSRTCNVVTLPVKQLLQLWISQETPVALRRPLAHLVTIVLELMWKFSGDPLVPVTTLPDTLAAMGKEIQICCKGLSFEERLEALRGLPNPWVQCIVSSVLLQEAIQCPRIISLASIVDLFYSTTSNSKNSAIYKPEYTKQVSNNLSHKENEESPVAHRDSLPNFNRRNSKCEDLLRTRTRDGKTAFDLAPTKEMFRLLMKYKGNSASCIPRSISPNMEDQKYHRELLVTLANCYLEVSGNRYIYYTITKCIYKVAKENFKKEKTEETDMDDDECQVVDKKMEKEITQKRTSQYLTLTENESLGNLSELEENAVIRVYKGIQVDKEVLKKRPLQNSAPVKKVDARLVFRTLCL